MGRNFALNTAQMQEAARLYCKGYAVNKLALVFGVSSQAVKNAMTNLGIPLRSIRQHYDINSVTIEKIKLNCLIDENECWNWQGHVRENGYCRTSVRGKSVYVHRLAHSLAKGRTPRNLDVCHTCDNRRCCNPDHLFLGTRETNMKDAKEKGRLSTGIMHSLAVKKGQSRSGYSGAYASIIKKFT